MLFCLFACLHSEESPRWYLKKGRYRDAYRSLERLRKTPLQAASDLYYIHSQIKMENYLRKSGDKVYRNNYINRLIQLFTVPRIRRATLASFTVMLAQQLCGSRLQLSPALLKRKADRKQSIFSHSTLLPFFKQLSIRIKLLSSRHGDLDLSILCLHFHRLGLLTSTDDDCYCCSHFLTWHGAWPLLRSASISRMVVVPLPTTDVSLSLYTFLRPSTRLVKGLYLSLIPPRRFLYIIGVSSLFPLLPNPSDVAY